MDAPTNTVGTFSYNLISVQDANTCQQSQTGSASITVNPTPTAINPGDRTYCLGETTSEILLSGTPSNVVFDITGGVSIGLNDQTDVSKIPSFIAREGSVTLQITPKANGCTGAIILVVINVFPLPNIQTPTSSQTICSGETTNINLSSSTPGATFSWVVVDAGTVTGASDGTGELISQTLENKTTSISDVTYQITANANNCEGATRDFTVTVHPEVTATISGGDTFCQNDAQPDITFTANGGTPPYTFTYNINGGANQEAIANSGNSVMVGVPTDVAGTFNYNLVSAAGSTNCPYPQSASETIIINSQPTLTSSLTPPGVCSNEAFNYIPTSNVAGTTFSWTRAAVPGIS
ncbi:MAG: PKD-like domain-containing protein, partial [Candidatus Pelagibacter ubique]